MSMTPQTLKEIEDDYARWCNDPENCPGTLSADCIACRIMEHLPALIAAVKERDQLKEGLAGELAENLELFNKVGLNCREDFGNDTSTAALSRKITEIIQERDAALKACAAYRDALEKIRDVPTVSSRCCAAAADVLESTDCGKDWVPKAELDAANAKCAEMRDVLECVWDSEGMRFIKDPESQSGDSECAMCGAVLPYGGHAEDCLQGKIHHALSTDYGKGYHHDRDIEPLVEALRRITDGREYNPNLHKGYVAGEITIGDLLVCNEALAHWEKGREGK